MSDEKKYEPLNDVEKALIYDFLERVQSTESFKENLIKDPEVTLSTATPNIPYTKLLRPNLLKVLGDLRRVALEEIGIDVSKYRDVLADNGFKLSYDNKD